MSGSIIRLPHPTSWRAERKIYNTQKATNILYISTDLIWDNNARSQYTKGHSTLESSTEWTLSYLSVFVPRCVSTRFYTWTCMTPAHSVQNVEVQYQGNVLWSQVIMYSLTLRVTLGEWLVNISGAFAKLRKVTISFVMSVRLPSVRPHGTTWLPMDGFSWNLTFEEFSKICRWYSGFNKIGQE